MHKIQQDAEVSVDTLNAEEVPKFTPLLSQKSQEKLAPVTQNALFPLALEMCSVLMVKWIRSCITVILEENVSSSERKYALHWTFQEPNNLKPQSLPVAFRRNPRIVQNDYQCH